jgi:hypothetical protein
MKRTVTMTFLLIFSGALLDAQTPAKPAKLCIVDVPESRIEFYVSSSDGEVYGTFGSWTGQLKVGAPCHPEVTTLDLKVSTESLWTLIRQDSSLFVALAIGWASQSEIFFAWSYV